jgi:hypothetical protein
MATYRTSLSEEITGEILNLTAGENTWTLPSERGETNTIDTQEALKNCTRENKAEINAMRRQLVCLRNCVIRNDEEIKELRGTILELREAMEELKGKAPESYSQSFSESRNTHVRDSVTRAIEDNLSNAHKKNVAAPTVSTSSVNNYLNNSEISLPLFDENTVNPVFHLKQLDNYIKLRNIPEGIQLTVAYRSLVGEMSKTWAETMVEQINDYPSFKRELLKTWWSPSQQSLVRCKLYQGKYTKNSKLFLSAYFLKQVTLVSYLDPKPTEVETVEALRFHYPVEVQRALLNIQTKTISETLEVPRRLELLEAQEQYGRLQIRNTNQIREDRHVKYRSPETRLINKTYRRSYPERNPKYNSRNGQEYKPRGNLGAGNGRTQHTEELWDVNPRTSNDYSGN